MDSSNDALGLWSIITESLSDMREYILLSASSSIDRFSGSLHEPKMLCYKIVEKEFFIVLIIYHVLFVDLIDGANLLIINLILHSNKFISKIFSNVIFS